MASRRTLHNQLIRNRRLTARHLESRQENDRLKERINILEKLLEEEKMKNLLFIPDHFIDPDNPEEDDNSEVFTVSGSEDPADSVKLEDELKHIDESPSLLVEPDDY